MTLEQQVHQNDVKLRDLQRLVAVLVNRVSVLELLTQDKVIKPFDEDNRIIEPKS